jgi:hypothetical protein
LSLTLGQTHAPGEKLFVDYPGVRIAIIVTQAGEIRDAELFVAVLGARTTRTPKRPGRSSCLTGSARITLHSQTQHKAEGLLVTDCELTRPAKADDTTDKIRAQRSLIWAKRTFE